MCLAVLLLCNAVPMDALAAEYYERFNDAEAPIKDGDRINPNDIFYAEKSSGGLFLTLEYIDENENSLCSDVSTSFPLKTYKGEGCYEVSVKTYQDAAGSSADPEKVSLFSHWKTFKVEISAGGFSTFSFQAVMKKKITYYLNGGTNSSENPSVYLPGEKEIELKPAGKANYDFVGWYTTLDCREGTEKTSITTTDTGDITLYAKYTPKTYTITYKLPDGTDLPQGVTAALPSNPKSYTFGVGVDSLPDVEQAGYTFGGWYEDQNCSGNEKTGITGADSGDKTLYAKLTPKSYKLHFNCNGGSYVGTAPTGDEMPYTYGTAITNDALPKVTKTGYDFVGWSKTSGGATIDGIPADTLPASGDTIELYAVYRVKSYQVTYKGRDGAKLETTGTPSISGTGKTDTFTYGTGISTDKLPKATLVGHTFKGWYDNESYTESPITSIPPDCANDITLYAKFEPNNYTVKFVLGDGGSYDDSGSYPVPQENAMTYVYSGEGISKLPQAKKTGHTFDGWYTAASGGELKTNISGTYIPPSGTEVTLYAHYSPKDYGITYLLPNGDPVPLKVTDGLPTQYSYGRKTEIKKTSGELSNAYNGVVCTGWYKDAALTIPVTAITAIESETVTLYGKFEAGLSYELDGGTTASANPSTYTYGIRVASFQPASKFGYTFGGWYTSADLAESTRVTGIAAAETGAKTLYAKYTPNSWSIEYNGNGGTVLNSGSTARYVYGVGISGANPNLTATKDNYDFAGWYMTPACTDGTKWEDVCNVTNGYKLAASYLPTKTDGKITLYAKYTPKTYRIEYRLPDGSDLPTEVVTSGLATDYVYGVGMDLSEATAVWGGVPCAGWYRDTELLEPVTAISPKDSGTKTLYAKFAWNIRYHNVDGAVHTNPDSYVYGAGVRSLADAEKTGYDFAGWFTEENCAEESRVTSVAATATGELHLYAKFTPATYLIHYELNGGTNDTANPVSYTYGEGVAAFRNATKAGYNFGGWYSDVDFVHQVTSISDTDTREITLYAKYEVVDYEITYETNGGINSVNNPGGYCYGTGVESFEPAVKAGHIFEGWYRSGDFSGEPVGSIPATETGNVTLYAKFDAADYAIAYETNGGSDPATNPRGYQYGKEVSGFADSVKQNYQFDGWYANADFSGNPITAISAGETGDKVLYAKFTPDSYTITYVLNDGSNAETNPPGYTYGEGVRSFADASRQGYTFGGWFSDPAFAELSRVTSLSEGHTGDVTLYAKFTENPAAPAPTPTPEPKTITPPVVPVGVPATGDGILGICLVAVLLVSGCGLLVIVWIRKRDRDNAA